MKKQIPSIEEVTSAQNFEFLKIFESQAQDDGGPVPTAIIIIGVAPGGRINLGVMAGIQKASIVEILRKTASQLDDGGMRPIPRERTC